MALSAPQALDWATLVAHAVSTRGSLAEVVRTLYELHGRHLPSDPATVERGLRRLRRRGHAPADKYGRLLLRNVGLPRSAQDYARELGTYHSALMDLPLSVRAAQLQLWDRPPATESAQAAWIHLGLASLAHHAGMPEDVAGRMELARLGLGRAGPAAGIEHGLFAARLASDAGGSPTGALEEVHRLTLALHEGPDRSCYLARVLDQQAYDVSRGARDEGLRAALTLRRSIPEQGPAFVRFRRAFGLAWTMWKLGDPGANAQGALALEISGDAGLLRLRAGALGLMAKLEPEAAAAYGARRHTILRTLG